MGMVQQVALKQTTPGIGGALRMTMVVTLLATLAYAVAVLSAGSQDIAAALARIAPADLVLALMLVICGYVFRLLRWTRFVSRLGHQIPVSRQVLYYIAGMAFSATPAKAGEAFRAVYLKRHDVPYTDSLGMVVAERGLDVLVMALLSLSLLLLVSDSTYWTVLAILSFGGLLLWLCRKRLAALARFLAGKLPDNFFRVLANRLMQSLATASHLTGRTVIIPGIGLGLLAWCSEAFAFWYLANSFGIAIAPAPASGVFAASLLLGVLSFLPGGVGGTEAAMIVMLQAAGGEISAIIAFVMVFRLLTLWFAVLLGFSAMGILRWNNSHWQGT